MTGKDLGAYSNAATMENVEKGERFNGQRDKIKFGDVRYEG